jgi:hypothetical protein
MQAFKVKPLDWWLSSVILNRELNSRHRPVPAMEDGEHIVLKTRQHLVIEFAMEARERSRNAGRSDLTRARMVTVPRPTSSGFWTMLKKPNGVINHICISFVILVISPVSDLPAIAGTVEKVGFGWVRLGAGRPPSRFSVLGV